jgi:hypothetical protein
MSRLRLRLVQDFSQEFALQPLREFLEDVVRPVGKGFAHPGTVLPTQVVVVEQHGGTTTVMGVRRPCCPTVAASGVFQVGPRLAHQLAVYLAVVDEGFPVSPPAPANIHVKRWSGLVFVDVEILAGNDDVADSRDVVPVTHISLGPTEIQPEVVTLDRADDSVQPRSTTVGVELDLDAGDAPVALLEGANDLLAHPIERKLPRLRIQERGSGHFTALSWMWCSWNCVCNP